MTYDEKIKFLNGAIDPFNLGAAHSATTHLGVTKEQIEYVKICVEEIKEDLYRLKDLSE